MAARWLRGLLLLVLLSVFLCSCRDSSSSTSAPPQPILLADEEIAPPEVPRQAARVPDEDEKARADEEPSNAPTEKIQAVLDIGGHSGSIYELVFARDGKRLYTVGEPGELHEWDVASGERLRVWRFPEQVIRLALAPDGKQLAVGGDHRPVEADGKKRASVWLINLDTGEARVHTTVVGDQVTRLAFSPDGTRLAINANGQTALYSLQAKPEPLQVLETGQLTALAFDPNRKRARSLLLTSRVSKEGKATAVRLFDLGGNGNDRPEALPKAKGLRPLAAWSPEGTYLAAISGGQFPGFHLWRPLMAGKHGAAIWEFNQDQLFQALAEGPNGKGLKSEEAWHPVGVVFAAEDEVLACWEQDSRVRIVRFAIAARKVELLPGDIPRQRHYAGIALHPEGRLLAMAGNPANRIVIYDLDQGKPRLYHNPESGRKAKDPFFGPPVPRPRFVGWTATGHGLLWGLTDRTVKNPTRRFDHGLNLHTLKPIFPKGRKETTAGSLPVDWNLELDESRQVVLTRPDRQVPINLARANPRLAKAFLDDKGQYRLLIPYRDGLMLAIVDPDTGKEEKQVGFKFFPVYDLAISPDHRYVAVAGGNLTLDVFALAQPSKPVLQGLFFQRDWVVWTPEGYYACTPGGDRLLGWKVAPSEEQLAQFNPVQAFKRTFYHPEVIQELLTAGSLKAAVARTSKNLVARDIQTVPPPVVEITAANQDPKDQGKWVIKARAQFAKGQAVEKMRLFVDGIPLPESEAIPQFKPEENQVLAEWIVPRMPESDQKVELRVLARCPDVSGRSPPWKIDTLPLAKKPVLHLVCIGLNYGNGHSAPPLKCPQNDAQAIAEAFATSCVGQNNLFGQARIHKLLGAGSSEIKAATTANIRDILLAVRKEVKPRDLLVFFFAGHGVREKQQFYLITQDARMKNLAKTALSGEDLRRAFADCPCRVLVLLDACYSATANLFLGQRGFHDAAGASWADEECEATLLAAALGREQALEPRGGQNGLFTQALLRALQGKDNVVFNRFDGRQYVTHLYTEVHDQVQFESKGYQHPFLMQPWTVESFPVRAVR